MQHLLKDSLFINVIQLDKMNYISHYVSCIEAGVMYSQILLGSYVEKAVEFIYIWKENKNDVRKNPAEKGMFTNRH